MLLVMVTTMMTTSTAAAAAAADQLPQQHRNQQECSILCPPGYGGYLCESRIVGQQQQQYSTLCLNGGTCITTTRTDPMTGLNVVENHCDCTSAVDRLGNRYAGKLCEHVSTSICDPNDPNLFCTQGGSCRGNPIEGCSCPTGTAGYKCEFLIGNSNSDNGVVDDSGSSNPPPPRPPTPPTTPDDGDNGDDDDDDDDEPEYCGEGICLNGGYCVLEEIVLEDGTRGNEEICDCSDAFNTRTGDVFAGPHCQYKATSICDSNNDPSYSGPNYGIDPNSIPPVSFCVHHGECQPDGSCRCKSGWTGEHCSIETSEIIDIDNPAEVEGDNSGSGGGNECGDTVCYHGGICVETEVVIEGRDTEIKSYCDCATAYDDEFLYAGESCQFPSTSLCSIPGGDATASNNGLMGSTFCTNHGRCPDTAINNIQSGCTCLEGFYGMSCEFERLNDEDGDGIPNNEDSNNFDNVVVPGPGPGQDDGLFEVCGDGDTVCYNQGTCVTVVETDVVSGEETTLYECDCGINWDGISCEVPINSEIIDDVHNDSDIDVEPCGEGLVCLNGGICQTTIVQGLDGEQTETQYCDCSTAFTGTDIFAGESCEHKATSFCTVPAADSLEDVVFCTNGGNCRKNHLEGCSCSAGWEGRSCEFAVDGDINDDELLPGPDDNDDDDDPFSCDLPCHNGSVCAHGAKDIGQLAQVAEAIGDVSHLNATFHAEQFAHCVCPKGFVGVLCETQLEVDICTIGAPSFPGQPLFFCLNSGYCNAYVEYGVEDPGCTCPDGYDGEHCELPTVSSQESRIGGSQNDIGPIIGIAIAVMVGVLALLGAGKRFIGPKAAAARQQADDAISQNTTPGPHAFPRRRRKAGFNGSKNLAPKRGSVFDSTPPRASISDPVVVSGTPPLTPDHDDTDLYHDEPDGIMNDNSHDEVDEEDDDLESVTKNLESVDFV